MRLLYFTPLTYPSRFGNRLQVMKMSAAFSTQADFALVLAKLHVPQEQIFEEYSIKKPFTVREVGLALLWPRSFWQAWRLVALISEADAGTVFYTRDVLMAFWLTFLSRRFRENYFFELHTLSRFPRWIYRRVLVSSRGIITTNARKKDDVVRIFGVDRGRVLVRGNGIDLEEFAALPGKEEARRQLGITTFKPLVVYAGTVAQNYGAGVMDVARRLLGGEAEIRVISGEHKTLLLTTVAADILIAPYLAANDHFRLFMSPMKIKEYMAAGRAMIVSDLPAIREILDESAAFFVAPGDAQALADMIRFVIAHPDEAAERAQHAEERARDFTWTKRAEDIIHFIESW